MKFSFKSHEQNLSSPYLFQLPSSMVIGAHQRHLNAKGRVRGRAGHDFVTTDSAHSVPHHPPAHNA